MTMTCISLRQTFRVAAASLVALATLGLGSCMRGGISSDPPVHLILDMDFQPKLRTQSAAEFEGWSDQRAQRAPVADPFGKTTVVARGTLANPALANRDANNAFVTKNPLAATHKMVRLGREVTTIERGRELFEIHCAICHGYTGQGGNDPKQGHGLVGRRWPASIPNFHFDATPGKDNRVPNMADGEYFEVITYGKGTMPAYGARLHPEERWAIVHYVRALQSLSK
jgi:mono/diheme cytochrome c family protein